MSLQAWLLWNVVLSSFGLGYFIYGKKQAKALPLACGIGLMIFPYFIDQAWALFAIGGLLLALPWLLRT